MKLCSDLVEGRRWLRKWLGIGALAFHAVSGCTMIFPVLVAFVPYLVMSKLGLGKYYPFWIPQSFLSFWIAGGVGFFCAFLELFISFRVTGDPLPAPAHFGERSIMIGNHPTRVDWLFMWCLYARKNMLHTMTVTLAQEFRSMPYLGWVNQFAGCFIARNKKKWEQNKQYLKSMIATFVDGCSKILLIFPEGRTVHGDPKNLAVSNKFADKMGLPHYTEVLHPRTLGLKTLVEMWGENLDTVYDYTLAYDVHEHEGPGHGNMPRETDFLPKTVHLHVRRMSRQEFLEECGGDPVQYVLDSFKRKNEVLKEFYAKSHPRTLGGELRPFQSSPEDPWQVPRVCLLYAFAVFTSCYTLYWYCFHSSWTVFYLMLATCGSCLVMGVIGTGWDQFIYGAGYRNSQGPATVNPAPAAAKVD